jgi:hypothetical protein
MTISPKSTVAAGIVASLAIAASASAAQAPTLGPLSIIKAGQKTPVDIAGNDLLRGATIRKGTELRRWLVTMHGASKTPLTLSCGPGARHIGLAAQDSSKLGFAVAKGSSYGKRTIKVRFYAAPKVDPDGARASVYALCKTS